MRLSDIGTPEDFRVVYGNMGVAIHVQSREDFDRLMAHLERVGGWHWASGKRLTALSFCGINDGPPKANSCNHYWHRYVNIRPEGLTRGPSPGYDCLVVPVDEFEGTCEPSAAVPEPKNNDGRLSCFWCSIPTAKRGGGMYDVCPRCGR